MTGNEPGVTGDDEQGQGDQAGTERADSAQAGTEQAGTEQADTEQTGQEAGRYGRMADAQDAAADQVRSDRQDAADAGDERARAEQSDDEQRTAGRSHVSSNRVRHAAEWLDGKLVPKLGPAELGPYDEESEESVVSHDVCPLCGHPMREHTIDRSTHNAVLNCPVPPRPQVQSFEPLNEVGMVRRRADRDAGS